MKTLMTFFFALLISLSALAQQPGSTLGSGMNVPSGVGSGVGSPSAVPLGGGPPPTPKLNDSTVNSGTNTTTDLNQNTTTQDQQQQEQQETSGTTGSDIDFRGQMPSGSLGTQPTSGLGTGVGSPDAPPTNSPQGQLP